MQLLSNGVSQLLDIGVVGGTQFSCSVAEQPFPGIAVTETECQLNASTHGYIYGSGGGVAEFCNMGVKVFGHGAIRIVHSK